jgi:hypothetical protein
VQSGLVSNIVASMAFLILVFLVVTNYKGLTAMMSAGGPQVVNLVKALQGR